MEKIKGTTSQKKSFLSSLLKLKRQILAEISRSLSKLNLSQRQAAKKIGVSQPELSTIQSGSTKGFSLERLFRFLWLFNKKIVVKISDKRKKSDPNFELSSQ